MSVYTAHFRKYIICWTFFTVGIKLSWLLSDCMRCRQNTPDLEGVRAVSFRQSGQQQKTSDGSTCWDRNPTVYLYNLGNSNLNPCSVNRAALLSLTTLQTYDHHNAQRDRKIAQSWWWRVTLSVNFYLHTYSCT